MNEWCIYWKQISSGKMKASVDCRGVAVGVIKPLRKIHYLICVSFRLSSVSYPYLCGNCVVLALPSPSDVRFGLIWPVVARYTLQSSYGTLTAYGRKMSVLFVVLFVTSAIVIRKWTIDDYELIWAARVPDQQRTHIEENGLGTDIKLATSQ